jgi:hypothetical protein
MNTIIKTVTSGVKSRASPLNRGKTLATGFMVKLDIFPKKLFTPGIISGLNSPKSVYIIIDKT